MSVTFQNPPAPTKWVKPVSEETQAILDELQSRPGEWALIKENVNVNVSTWWKKRQGIEAKASTVGKAKNKCDVYARYVGKEAA
ncbi:hypothetical protein ASF74_14770 [Arthrobacter sp. Leaf145]|nr:hypothetical protein ASF74_14770 [Arthrobacter sp. Leaf145]